MPKAAVTLQLDDGTSENTIGDEGQFMWINRFTPAPADFPVRVDSVDVVFGSGEVTIGDPVEVFVYEDTDGDGDPGTNAVLRAMATGTVQANDAVTASTITFAAGPVLEVAGDLLIGVVNRAGAEGINDFPATLDQTASQGRSWAATWLAGDVPANPTLPADEQWGTIDSFGFAGNWLVRANIETNAPIPDDDPPVMTVNTGLTLDEGAQAVITAAMLQATDPDTDDDLLTYAITTAPGLGQLELVSAPGVGISSFTQAQLNASQVMYVHDDSDSTFDLFEFDVQDGSGNNLTDQTFFININPVDDQAPTLTVSAGITVVEGGSGVIDSSVLQANDVDTDNTTLTFVVTTAPTNGQLELSTAPGTIVGSFTQAQLNAAQVVYMHDDSNTTSDGFTFDIEDGSGNNLTGQTFPITITAIDDDAPTMLVNAGLTVAEGGSGVLDSSVLQATDADSDDAQLLFTVTSAPANGQIEFASAPGVAVGSFTQAQRDAGQLLYVHDDSNTSSDSFTFDVEDGSGNTLTGQVFSITVTAVGDDMVQVNPASLSIAEGASGSFTVVLSTEPTGTVIIDLASVDTSIATVSPAQLTFSTVTWSVPQTVTVQGVGDSIAGGDRATQITVSVAAGTTDPTYAALAPGAVGVTVLDDDAAGVTLSPSSGLTTSEDGGTDTMTVVLDSQPLSDVVVTLTSSDPGEGTVAPSQLTFTAGNWNVPQTVTLTGVDDGGIDDAQSWSVLVSVASADPAYDGLAVTAAGVVNEDDDAVPPLGQPTMIPTASHGVLGLLALMLFGVGLVAARTHGGRPQG